MAELNKTDFTNKYGTTGTHWTDTPGSIIDDSFKEFGQDIADSLPFLVSLKTVRRTVSSAEILDLFDTPITIINAPGSGNMINIISIVCKLDYGTVAYVQGGNSLVFQYPAPKYIFADSSLLEDTVDSVMMFSGNQFSPFPLSEIENQPFQLAHLVANPTTGDGTLLIDIVYSIIAL